MGLYDCLIMSTYLFKISILSFKNSHSTEEKVKAALKAVKFQTGKTYTAEAMTKALSIFDRDMRKDNETAKVIW